MRGNAQEIRSNPFQHTQQKKGAPLFNTPFYEESSDSSVQYQNNSNGWGDQHMEDNGNEDFNFVADPPQSQSEQINIVGNGYHQRHEEVAFVPVRQEVRQQPQIPQRAPLNPTMMQQPGKQNAPPLRTPFPQQHQPIPQQYANGFGQDEMISLEKIEIETQNQQRAQMMGRQPMAGQPMRAPLSQPFPQQHQDQSFEKGGLQRQNSLGNEEDELPLLEDLGIDIEKIKEKFKSIMTQSTIKDNADYDDMAGPLLVCVIFGILLMFKGKVQFGYIYGFGLSGCLGIYFIINLMSKRNQLENPPQINSNVQQYL